MRTANVEVKDAFTVNIKTREIKCGFDLLGFILVTALTCYLAALTLVMATQALPNCSQTSANEPGFSFNFLE